jgi:predicted small integral membrane protein
MADTNAPAAKVVAPVQRKGRRGFLPITTNTFDRVFISVILLIGISLLWMRFLEWAMDPAVGLHRALPPVRLPIVRDHC